MTLNAFLTISDDDSVSHVSKKLKATDIQSLKLGNCLQQLKNGNREEIKFIYPPKEKDLYVTFEDAFEEEGKLYIFFCHILWKYYLII